MLRRDKTMFRSIIKWLKRLITLTWLLIVILVGAKIAQLNDGVVQVDLWYWQMPEASLGLVLCLALLVGVVLGLLAFLPALILARTQVHRLKAKTVKTEHELQHLRSSPIEA